MKNPVKTVLIMELPAIFPWSWHTPKFPLTIQNSCFDDAKNVISFVDGHVGYTPVYFRLRIFPSPSEAAFIFCLLPTTTHPPATITNGVGIDEKLRVSSSA